MGKHLNFEISNSDRLALKGSNGSGKTTLVKLILGTFEPTVGVMYRSGFQGAYIDQDYSLLDNRLSVYQQVEQFNTSALQEHELKMRLSRFLFAKEIWNRSCEMLSGGERMRLLLCGLTISNKAADFVIFDEPTNNLDMQNIEILMAAINQFQGSLLVVSHDQSFLEQINIQRSISL